MNVDYFFNEYAHQIIGNIYRMFLEHIVQNLTDRFQTKIMGTYHKAVETLRNANPSLEPNVRLPAICVDPTTPLQLESKTSFLWRMPLSSVLSKRLFEPIYQDSDIRITPGFVRYESQISVYMWFDSLYEKIDTELRFLQAFHSIEKWSKPYGMEVLCPLPEKVYTYDNPYGIVINWPDSVFPRLLETIDKQIPMFPLYLAPMVKMTTLSDISTKDKDSGDEIGSYRLQADFTLEFEVPTYYLVETHWRIEKLECNIATKDVITGSVIFHKEMEFISNPNEPTDPDRGIIVPQHVIPQVGSKFENIDVKKVWIWNISEDGIFSFPENISDVTGVFCMKSGGFPLDEVCYNYNEETQTISFSTDCVESGSLVYIIVF